MEPSSSKSSSDTLRRRFSRTLSVYDDPDTGSGAAAAGTTNGYGDTASISNGVTNGVDTETEPSKYKYSSGYVRYMQHADCPFLFVS